MDRRAFLRAGVVAAAAPALSAGSPNGGIEPMVPTMGMGEGGLVSDGCSLPGVQDFTEWMNPRRQRKARRIAQNWLMQRPFDADIAAMRSWSEAHRRRVQKERWVAEIIDDERRGFLEILQRHGSVRDYDHDTYDHTVTL